MQQRLIVAAIVIVCYCTIALEARRHRINRNHRKDFYEEYPAQTPTPPVAQPPPVFQPPPVVQPPPFIPTPMAPPPPPQQPPYGGSNGGGSGAAQPPAPQPSYGNGGGVTMDCRHRTDGLYGHGCQRHFSYCHNGNHASQTCPYGLHYDADHSMCNYPGFISACNGGRKYDRYNQPIDSNGSNSNEAPPSITPMPSSGIGSSGAAQAPPQQSPYGSSSGGSGSGAAQPPPQQSPYGSSSGGSGSGAAQPPPQIGGSSGGQSIPHHHCSRGSNGYFSFGCSSRFYHCVAGSAVAIDCPAGLFYDKKLGQCDYPANVPACGGSSTMQ